MLPGGVLAKGNVGSICWEEAGMNRSIIGRLVAFVTVMAVVGGAFWGSALGGPPLVGAQVGHQVILPLVFKDYEAPPPPATYFGIWLGGGDLRDVNNLREAGSGWTIVHLSWARVQPTSSSAYDFSAYDNLLRELTAAGVKPIVQIRDNPAWAAATPCGPISELDDFAAFVNQTVLHYKGAPYNVKHWEFYNEPDYRLSRGLDRGIFLGGCWGDNPAEYAQMLQSAAGVIRPLDSNARILMGGLAHEALFTDYFNMDFLAQVIDAGGANYFDVANVHFFSTFGPHWQSIYGADRPDVIGKVTEMRAILGVKGVSKPIALTEVSYTGEDTDFANDQASYVGKVLARALYASVIDLSKPVHAMTWFSLDWDGDRNYALLDATGTPRPAYGAFRTAAHELGRVSGVYGPLAPQAVGVGGGIEGYSFDVQGEQRWILWASPDDSSLWITLPARAKAAYDRAGQAIPLNVGSPTNLLISDSPIYVRLNP